MRHEADDFEAEDITEMANFDGDFNSDQDSESTQEEYENFSEFEDEDDEDEMDDFFGKNRRKKNNSNSRNLRSVRSGGMRLKSNPRLGRKPLGRFSRIRKMKNQARSRGVGAKLRNTKVIRKMRSRGVISKPEAEALTDRVDARFGDESTRYNRFEGDDDDDFQEFFGKKAKERRKVRKSLIADGASRSDARKLARDQVPPIKIGDLLKKKFQDMKKNMQNSGEIDDAPIDSMADSPISPENSGGSPPPEREEKSNTMTFVYIGVGVAVLGTAAFLIFRK